MTLLTELFGSRLDWFTNHEGKERNLTAEEFKKFKEPFVRYYDKERDPLINTNLMKECDVILAEWNNKAEAEALAALGFRPYVKE